MFNISEFKSRINRHNGLSFNSLFVVEINNPFLRINRVSPSTDSPISSDDLRFFCQAVTVPGINLEVMQYRPTGVGFPEFMPMSSIPGTLNCVFMLDSNHNIITFFHRWINSVINVGGNIGRSGAFEGESREINYKSQYETTMVIRHYSTHGKSALARGALGSVVPSQGDEFGFYEYKFEGVYPTEVGGNTLSWSDNSVSTSSINFSYSRIIHSGFQFARPEDSIFITGSQNSLRGLIPQIEETVLPQFPINIT